jgi:hypothetical protein
MEDNNHTLTEAETAEATAASNTYTLTEDERSQIAAIAKELQTLQEEAGVVIRSIARARGLNGNWTFNPNSYTFTKG